MDYKTICETDADYLLEFEVLANDGFAFTYAKKENNTLQQFVNCNGKVFGPFDRVSWFDKSMGEADWKAYKGDDIFRYYKNGEICKKIEKLTQEEIDKLSQEREKPEEEDDEKRHILRLIRKNQKFFITEKRRFGPYYQIHDSKYLDEEHFQFTYTKRANSKRWFYNLNGREIGPFNNPGYMHVYYDKQNRAVLDEISKGNYIYIDGKKIKCFKAPHEYCRLYVCNGHEIFTGVDLLSGKYHFKRDGIESDILVAQDFILDNGDIVYSKTENDTETWFYNDTPISVSVKGKNSWIHNSIISYRRTVSKKCLYVPYFMMGESEFQGVITNEINPKSDFAVWLQSGKIFFGIQCSEGYTKNYEKARDGNFLRLFYTHRLAGRD